MEQENVWEYPRPPALETVPQTIKIVHRGEVIALTSHAMRILETSHPPTYYIPPQDVKAVLLPHPRRSFCEFKGNAYYWHLGAEPVAWSYPHPEPRYAALAGYFAFYASRVDECWVGDERVIPQQGDFYGGWLTSNLVGPFKGGPGSALW